MLETNKNTEDSEGQKYVVHAGNKHLYNNNTEDSEGWFIIRPRVVYNEDD